MYTHGTFIVMQLKWLSGVLIFSGYEGIDRNLPILWGTCQCVSVLFCECHLHGVFILGCLLVL